VRTQVLCKAVASWGKVDPNKRHPSHWKGKLGERQTRASRIFFSAKVFALRVERVSQSWMKQTTRWPKGQEGLNGRRVAVRSRLFIDGRKEELQYELGKVANLRAAIQSLDEIVVPAGEVFSFWKQVGRATSRRGFVRGRMLQGGCVVPAIGGGLCQLSNALYELALASDCEIVERHPHSVRLPGMPLHDATVAWNYVDLRFRPRSRLRIEIKLTSSELIAAFVSESLATNDRHPALPILDSRAESGRSWKESIEPVETCATCSEVDCSRHERPPSVRTERKAFLLDAYWPEINRYVQQTKNEGDWLMVPLDGNRWRLPQYAWSLDGFEGVVTQPIRTLVRSVKSRRLGTQGAARQMEMLRAGEAMGRAMARQLPSDVTHVVIDQAMLPELWRSGALGGRTFDVVMRRHPMRVLQSRLDEVADRWPMSRTAADFRAGDELLYAEDEALEMATHIVTCHQEIADLFAARAIRLDWMSPQDRPFKRQTAGTRPRVYFPGPVAARKGAYELREALRGLDVELLYGGSDLEGEGFWDLIANRRGLGDLAIAAVVQPAYIEERPTALLRAIASGIPAIATPACGLAWTPGLEIVDVRDVYALRDAMERLLARATV
jgi:hypothetical protein